MPNFWTQTKIRCKGFLNNQDFFQGICKRRNLKFRRGLIKKKSLNFLQSLRTSSMGVRSQFPNPYSVSAPSMCIQDSSELLCSGYLRERDLKPLQRLLLSFCRSSILDLDRAEQPLPRGSLIGIQSVPARISERTYSLRTEHTPYRLKQPPRS